MTSFFTNNLTFSKKPQRNTMQMMMMLIHHLVGGSSPAKALTRLKLVSISTQTKMGKRPKRRDAPSVYSFVLKPSTLNTSFMQGALKESLTSTSNSSLFLMLGKMRSKSLGATNNFYLKIPGGIEYKDIHDAFLED